MRVLTLSGLTFAALLTAACGGADQPAETPPAETPAVEAPDGRPGIAAGPAFGFRLRRSKAMQYDGAAWHQRHRTQ